MIWVEVKVFQLFFVLYQNCAENRKRGKQGEKKTFLVKVSRVSKSLLLLSKDRAPTLLPRASLIGSPSANMLPCALTLTKTDRLERHTTHGASRCQLTLQEQYRKNSADYVKHGSVAYSWLCFFGSRLYFFHHENNMWLKRKFTATSTNVRHVWPIWSACHDFYFERSCSHAAA